MENEIEDRLIEEKKEEEKYEAGLTFMQTIVFMGYMLICIVADFMIKESLEKNWTTNPLLEKISSVVSYSSINLFNSPGFSIATGLISLFSITGFCLFLIADFKLPKTKIVIGSLIVLMTISSGFAYHFSSKYIVEHQKEFITEVVIKGESAIIEPVELTADEKLLEDSSESDYLVELKSGKLLIGISDKIKEDGTVNFKAISLTQSKEVIHLNGQPYTQAN